LLTQSFLDADTCTPRHLRLPDTFPSGTGAGQVCATQSLTGYVREVQVKTLIFADLKSKFLRSPALAGGARVCVHLRPDS